MPEHTRSKRRSADIGGLSWLPLADQQDGPERPSLPCPKGPRTLKKVLLVWYSLWYARRLLPGASHNLAHFVDDVLLPTVTGHKQPTNQPSSQSLCGPRFPKGGQATESQGCVNYTVAWRIDIKCIRWRARLLEDEGGKKKKKNSR